MHAHGTAKGQLSSSDAAYSQILSLSFVSDTVSIDTDDKEVLDYIIFAYYW